MFSTTETMWTEISLIEKRAHLKHNKRGILKGIQLESPNKILSISFSKYPKKLDNYLFEFI